MGFSFFMSMKNHKVLVFLLLSIVFVLASVGLSMGNANFVTLPTQGIGLSYVFTLIISISLIVLMFHIIYVGRNLKKQIVEICHGFGVDVKVHDLVLRKRQIWEGQLAPKILSYYKPCLQGDLENPHAYQVRHIILLSCKRKVRGNINLGRCSLHTEMDKLDKLCNFFKY